MKKSNITDRVRNAWEALLGRPAKTITLGVDMVRCSECDYYKRATEPAEITQAAPPNRYYHEITYMDDIVQVVLYEATEDGAVELTRRYGQILHEGAKGIAQATSYAMRGVWEQVRSKEGET